MSVTSKPPSAKQLRYLRGLAMQRGESFAYPQSFAEASAEIRRLKGRPASSASERRIELDQVSRDMGARGNAASVRDFEVDGYGSAARWR